MKQIAKSEKINGLLRAAFGADANLEPLVVFETGILNTKPLRKASGLFKGARVSLSLLSEIATSVNNESVPLQLQHDNEVLPYGRLFYAQTIDDEAVGYLAIDQVRHPGLVRDLDTGVVDQVSVGMANKRLTCSGCGYDYMDPSNQMGLWTLTCDEGHVLGEKGIHLHIDGLEQLFELSLVGKGAAGGARIVGPSDARLQANEQYRLAASANPGMHVLQLSSIPEDLPSMTPEFQAAYTAAVEGGATAKAALGIAEASVVTLTAANAALVTENAALTAAGAEAVAHKAGHDAAVAALTVEATKILTACGKPVDKIPTDVTGLLAVIDENRAAFAAIIPVEGVSTSVDASTTAKPVRSNGAFRSPPTNAL